MLHAGCQQGRYCMQAVPIGSPLHDTHAAGALLRARGGFGGSSAHGGAPVGQQHAAEEGRARGQHRAVQPDALAAHLERKVAPGRVLAPAPGGST